MPKITLLLGGLSLTLLPLSTPLAQPNPFKVPKHSLKGAQVTYSLSGDMQGTATVAFDGDRYVRSSKATMKIMGKTSSTEDWVLTTPDSMYRADLTRKQGYVSPNPLPAFARAYDQLEGVAKKRFHQNILDLGTMMGSAVGLGNVMAGEKTGTRTYAGHECEERNYGTMISLCQIEKSPVVLHTNASLVCMKFEETATEVRLAPPSGEAFGAPAGVTFVPDPHLGNVDSVAQGFVGYLSSQELTDSIAKAKVEMAKLEADAAAKGQTPEATATPEQKAGTEAACELIKNVDMGQVMAEAGNAWKKAMAEALKNEAKNQAVKGVKGLIKKPRIP